MSGSSLPCGASLLNPTDFAIPALETAELRILGEAPVNSKPGQELGDWVLSRPDHDAVREELADLGLALEEERYEEALEILRIRSFSAFDAVESQLWRARILIELKRFSEATEVLDALLVEGQPPHPRVELLQILARIEGEKPTAAWNWKQGPFAKPLPLDPWLIRVFAGMKGTPGSELLLAPLREADGSSAPPSVLCDAAAQLFDHGDFEGARKLARRALEIDPLEARGQFLLGSSLLAEQRIEEAHHALRKAVRLRPDHPESLANLATALHQIGRKEESLFLLILALENRIDFAEAWNNYLVLLARDLLPNGSLENLPNPPEESSASPAKWHWQAALSAMKKGDIGVSASHFLRSLSLDLNEPNTHNDLAVLLTRTNHETLALPFLRAAAFLSPDSKLVSQNLENLVREVRELAFQPLIEELNEKLAVRDELADRALLAELLEKVGREQEAIDQWRLALKSDPKSTGHRLALSRLLSRDGRFTEALSVFRPLLEADPENPEWLFRAAWLLLRHTEPSEANLDEAVALASKACELTKFQNRDCLELLATSLSARGREEEALTIRTALRKLDEEDRIPE